MSGISVNLNVKAHFDGALLKEAGKLAGEVGQAVEHGAKEVGEAVGQAAEGAGKAVGGVAQGYVDERSERASGVMDKLGQGNIIDAAIDVFQAFSPGGRIADGAKALGLIKSDSDKYLLSGIVNALVLGPLNPATIGDAEDFLKTSLPHIEKVQGQLESLGSAPRTEGVACAGSHHVNSPQVQIKKNLKLTGYKTGRSRVRNPKKHIKSKKFAQTIKFRASHSQFASSFERDVPNIIRSIETRGVGAAGPSQNGPSRRATQVDRDLLTVLKDPSLSFEEKLFLFMLAIAAKQEKKIKNLIAKFESSKGGKKNAQSPKGAAGNTGAASPSGATAGALGSESAVGDITSFIKGQGPDVIRFAGSALAIAAPVIGMAVGAATGSVAFGAGAIPGTAIGGAVGSLVGLAGTFVSNMAADGLESGAFDQLIPGGSGAQNSPQTGVSSASASSSSNTSNTASNGPKNDSDSKQQHMMKLQWENDKLSKMYGLVSALMKSMHTTQMTAVRNMR